MAEESNIHLDRLERLKIDDTILQKQFAKGDPSFLAGIYNRYANELLSYGTGLGFEREAIKDAIHDVFCHLFTHRNKYIETIRKIKPYLFKSLRNRLINMVSSGVEEVDISGQEHYFSVKVNIVDQMIQEEERRYLQDKIGKYLNCLTNRQREAIYLRFMQELDYDEIAELLQITPHSVRKLISSAIIRMREQKISFLTIPLSSLTILVG